MNVPVSPEQTLIESNRWQIQVYAICDYDRVQYPDSAEWNTMRASWNPGKKARDSVNELLEARRKEQDAVDKAA